MKAFLFKLLSHIKRNNDLLEFGQMLHNKNIFNKIDGDITDV